MSRDRWLDAVKQNSKTQTSKIIIMFLLLFFFILVRDVRCLSFSHSLRWRNRQMITHKRSLICADRPFLALCPLIVCYCWLKKYIGTVRLYRRASSSTRSLNSLYVFASLLVVFFLLQNAVFFSFLFRRRSCRAVFTFSSLTLTMHTSHTRTHTKTGTLTSVGDECSVWRHTLFQTKIQNKLNRAQVVAANFIKVCGRNLAWLLRQVQRIHNRIHTNRHKYMSDIHGN